VSSPLADRNTGHGHVFQRLDGLKARCGGPALCTECSLDMARAEVAQRAQQSLPDECCFRDCREPPVANSKWGAICYGHSFRLAEGAQYWYAAPSSNEQADISDIYAWVRAMFDGHFPSMDQLARKFYECRSHETRDDDPARWLLRWLNNRGGLGFEKHGLIDAVLEGRAYVRNDQLYTDGPTPPPAQQARDGKETTSCDCPEVCKVCGGRAKACAVLGHRPENDRPKWHECLRDAKNGKDSHE
jgi:hypothetical protein